MQAELKIGQKILLEGREFKVIGMDTYTLKDYLGKIKKWISYTLIDNKGNKIWISYGTVKEYFIQWFLITEKEFKKLAKTTTLNLDLSGIANISFEGNPGYSTPVAELLSFDLKNQLYDYIGIERFLEQKDGKIEPLTAYYDAGKILRNFKY